jgi:putative nucleotidyltransferase with HDIG domain
MTERGIRPPRPLHVFIFGVALAVALVAALFPFFPRQLSVSEGDIAVRDIRSPQSKTFVSDVLTEQAREQAAAAVPEVLVFDSSLRTQQLTSLTEATTAVASVRDNNSLDASAKRARLLGIQGLSGLTRTSIDTVLTLSNERWSRVTDEAQRVLSDILNTSVAPEAVTAEQNSAIQRVGTEFSANEANLVADLLRPQIVATLSIDQAATEEARSAATENVQPVSVTIAQGQTIVEADGTIDGATVEVLEEVGLLEPRVHLDSLAAVAIVAGVIAAIAALYVWHFPARGVTSQRNLLLLAVVIAVPVFIAKLYFSLVLPDEDGRFLAYFLPLAAAPMLLATLLETRLAVLIALLQAALMTFAIVYLPDVSLVDSIQAVDAERVLLVYGLGSVVGVFAVQRAQRVNQYAAAGVLVLGTELALLVALWLLEPEREAFDMVWMAAAATSSGLSAGLLTAGGFTVVGAVLGVTTRVQLMELSQLNAPLLRRLQDDAPGTFHHSIIVGNLAERAADLIGADSLLVRVGCYYHDIGKVLQPGFYIENQQGGENPHDSMDPLASARVIAEHVRGGAELAEKHNLPPMVRSFIPEHHGTRLIPFFYRKAAQKDPHVDQEIFRYPGPRPQTRETAIVMLADSTEATARASEDRTPERIDAIVEQVIAERLGEGELDESDLTLRDIRTIAESFKQTLRAVYHPRIAYPEPSEDERSALIGRFRPGRRAPEAAVTPPAAGATGRRRRRVT